MKKTLCDLRVGQSGVVAALPFDHELRHRLSDLGLRRGETVECIGTSPLGDPKAYRICGAVIALRRSDASRVRLRGRQG